MNRRIKIKDYNNIYLDLGCGNKDHNRPEKEKNNIGMDVIDYGQEIVWNATEGIPLPDNSVEHITTSHFIEHFREEDVVKIMNECWRVLKKDKELYVICPSFYRDKSWLPVHLWHPTEVSFRFFEWDKISRENRVKSWKINEFILNDKKDIHCKKKPNK